MELAICYNIMRSLILCEPYRLPGVPQSQPLLPFSNHAAELPKPPELGNASLCCIIYTYTKWSSDMIFQKHGRHWASTHLPREMKECKAQVVKIKIISVLKQQSSTVLDPRPIINLQAATWDPVNSKHMTWSNMTAASHSTKRRNVVMATVKAEDRGPI